LRNIAIIPARGGSHRLAGKNILEFHGKPIIAWTIAAALESKCFEKIVVSTEDPEIAKVASKYGADVLVRPAELANDEARVVDVCLHVLEAEKQSGREYDVLCCLYPTAPLRASSDIKAVLERIEPGVCEFSLAVTHYYYPPHQALRKEEDNTVTPIWPEWVNKREDELGTIVVDNGSTYAVVTSEFKKQKSFYGKNLKSFTMPHARSVDINYLEDMEMARYFYTKINE